MDVFWPIKMQSKFKTRSYLYFLVQNREGKDSFSFRVSPEEQEKRLAKCQRDIYCVAFFSAIFASQSTDEDPKVFKETQKGLHSFVM